MSKRFEEYYQELHTDVNKRLGQLHFLHHKQQILNIQLIATQILPRLDNCTELVDMIDRLINKSMEGINSDNLGSIIHYLADFLEQIEAQEQSCQEKIIDLSSHIKTYLRLISRESTSFKEHIQYNDLSKLDSVRAYREIIDPLSNQKRMDILLAIHLTKKRFKDLEIELDLQAGHLIYHLNPLKEANYVKQDEKKNYMLTEKGRTILEAVKHIYDNYLRDQ